MADDHLHRAEPFTAVARRARMRLDRANRRWRKANPELVELLEHERRRRETG